jgi:hypothetical protein
LTATTTNRELQHVQPTGAHTHLDLHEEIQADSLINDSL